MSCRKLTVALVASLAVALAAPLAEAQRTSPTDDTVKPARFESPANAKQQQAVRFTRRAAQIGDSVEQQISLMSRMTTVHRKNNEVNEQTKVEMRAKQQREITTKGVENGRATAVRVHYAAAGTVVEARGSRNEQEDSPEPVVGKSYLCLREGGPEGDLRITYEDGTLPPMDEYEIVARHMETVGCGNPLADFLAGQTIEIGETLDVPKVVAARLLNLDFDFGSLSRFQLKLEKVEENGDAKLAVFSTHIEAASSGSSQMKMQVEGPLVVDADSCRTVKVDLTGPIGMTESRGSYSMAYQVIGTGQLQMKVASTYRDAKRKR
jgi:hypothetical protein